MQNAANGTLGWALFWKDNDYNSTQLLSDDVNSNYQLGSTSILNILEDSSNPSLGDRISIQQGFSMFPGANIELETAINNWVGVYNKLGGDLNRTVSGREEMVTKLPLNIDNTIFKGQVFIELKKNQILQNNLPYFKINIKVKYDDGSYANLPLFMSELIVNPDTYQNLNSSVVNYKNILDYQNNLIYQINYSYNFSEFVDLCRNPIATISFSTSDSDDTIPVGINAYFFGSINNSLNSDGNLTQANKHLCVGDYISLSLTNYSGINAISSADTTNWIVTNNSNSNSETFPGNTSLFYVFSQPGSYTINYQIIKGNGSSCILTGTVYTGDFTQCDYNCKDCTSFDLQIGEKYLISGWINVMDEQSQGEYTRIPNLYTYDSAFIEVKYIGTDGLVINPTQEIKFYGNGEIIDGWQKIQGELIIPSDIDDIKIGLVNQYGNNEVVFFDDIRIHPYNANMKSFVYDQKTQRLMAELDENNYATFYEYDKEGGLVRVKKETEKGVYTIQETRSSTRKITE